MIGTHRPSCSWRRAQARWVTHGKSNKTTTPTCTHGLAQVDRKTAVHQSRQAGLYNTPLERVAAISQGNECCCVGLSACTHSACHNACAQQQTGLCRDTSCCSDDARQTTTHHATHCGEVGTTLLSGAAGLNQAPRAAPPCSSRQGQQGDASPATAHSSTRLLGDSPAAGSQPMHGLQKPPLKLTTAARHRCHGTAAGGHCCTRQTLAGRKEHA
jgi:hypothetical protein